MYPYNLLNIYCQEITLVDEGSSDQTRGLLCQYHQEDPRFVVVILARNHGHQLVLPAGLKVATGEKFPVLNAMPEGDRFIRGIVSWVGYPQTPFPYHRDERFAGETKYSLRKMLSLRCRSETFPALGLVWSMRDRQ